MLGWGGGGGGASHHLGPSQRHSDPKQHHLGPKRLGVQLDLSKHRQGPTQTFTNVYTPLPTFHGHNTKYPYLVKYRLGTIYMNNTSSNDAWDLGTI